MMIFPTLFPTSACCPGDKTLPHSLHFRQFGCQSFPSDVFLSAEINVKVSLRDVF